ncbi:formin-J-like isoform X2 [Ambystoma mexicanum]|uniref:formin-J-like isoform X2 n=1 Tax=Ambystoma mexicanum TaxID=8296 RepID=UPI0037E84FCC
MESDLSIVFGDRPITSPDISGGRQPNVLRNPEILAIESHLASKGNSPRETIRKDLSTYPPITTLEATSAFGKMYLMRSPEILAIETPESLAAGSQVAIKNARSELTQNDSSITSKRNNLEETTQFAKMIRLNTPNTLDNECSLTSKGDSIEQPRKQKPTSPKEKEDAPSKPSKLTENTKILEQPHKPSILQEPEKYIPSNIPFNENKTVSNYIACKRMKNTTSSKNSESILLERSLTIIEPVENNNVQEQPKQLSSNLESMNIKPICKDYKENKKIANTTTCKPVKHVTFGKLNETEEVNCSSTNRKPVEDANIQDQQKKNSNVNDTRKIKLNSISLKENEKVSNNMTCKPTKETTVGREKETEEVMWTATSRELVENTNIQEQLKKNSNNPEPAKFISSRVDLKENESIANTAICKKMSHRSVALEAEKVNLGSNKRELVEKTNIEGQYKKPSNNPEPAKFLPGRIDLKENENVSNTVTHKQMNHRSLGKVNETEKLNITSSKRELIENSQEQHKKTHNNAEPLKFTRSRIDLTENENVSDKVLCKQMSHRSLSKGNETDKENFSCTKRETDVTSDKATQPRKRYEAFFEQNLSPQARPVCLLEKHKGKLVRVQYGPAGECPDSAPRPLYESRILDIQYEHLDASKRKDESETILKIGKKLLAARDDTAMKPTPIAAETVGKVPGEEGPPGRCCELLCRSLKSSEQNTCENETRTDAESETAGSSMRLMFTKKCKVAPSPKNASA